MVRAFRAFLAALALSVCAFIPPAPAQPVPCLDRGQLAQRLASEYSEVLHAAGLAADGRVIEIYASPQGTWTLVMTLPDGRSCLLSWGEAWQLAPVKDPGRVS